MTRIDYVGTIDRRGLRNRGALGSFVARRTAARQITPDATRSIDAPPTVTEAVLPSVARGEPGAAEACLDRFGGLVWSLARKYFARRGDAEDAVQEAFLSLWENAGRFDPAVASETTFVAMIARRRMIDLVRKAGAARRSLDADRARGADAPPPVEELVAAEPNRVEAGGVLLSGFEVAEEAARVRVQLARLSEEQQRVLELALVEGQSQTQISELTGWPLGTVKSHARRGLKRLRELLAESVPNTPQTEAPR